MRVFGCIRRFNPTPTSSKPLLFLATASSCNFSVSSLPSGLWALFFHFCQCALWEELHWLFTNLSVRNIQGPTQAPIFSISLSTEPWDPSCFLLLILPYQLHLFVVPSFPWSQSWSKNRMQPPQDPSSFLMCSRDPGTFRCLWNLKEIWNNKSNKSKDVSKIHEHREFL